MPDESFVDECLRSGVADEYKLTKIGFIPDVIYDIGADVGSVTMWAHQHYPTTKIIAIEPNPWSYPRLEKNAMGIPEIIPVHAAVGQGPMYEPADCDSPLHWVVLSKHAPSYQEDMVLSTVPSVTLAELYEIHGGEEYVVKMDCESAEYGIITHPESRAVIFNSAFFAAELHFWGQTQAMMNIVVERIMRFLFDLAQSHTIYSYAYGATMHVWAKKRINQSVVPWNG